MPKLQKTNIKSITTINSILFLFIVFFNLTYLTFELSVIHLYYLLNFLSLLLFYLFNKRFEIELIEWKEGIKILSDSNLKWKDKEVKDLLFKKMFYKENDDNYRLVKNMYIRKTIDRWDIMKYVYLGREVISSGKNNYHCEKCDKKVSFLHHLRELSTSKSFYVCTDCQNEMNTKEDSPNV